MTRTVMEIRSSRRVRSFAISMAATTWPIAGDGTNTSSVFSITNVCLFSEQIDGGRRGYFPWLCHVWKIHLKMNLVAKSYGSISD